MQPRQTRRECKFNDVCSRACELVTDDDNSRPLTLDVPGLTKSKISPDGKIAQRDIGAKLVIIMVGLPARGKSYITKKIVRYLNWLQHDAMIFNVGHRRRRAAGMEVDQLASTPTEPSPMPFFQDKHHDAHDDHHQIDQSSSFFDPQNREAAELRERVAMETLDELLRYVTDKGSVGILDATNSTVERRKHIVDRIREVAGKDLGILFIESSCTDDALLEANMRLKLNGPDYKGRDPQEALEDFKRRGMYPSPESRSSLLIPLQCAFTRSPMFPSVILRRSRDTRTSRWLMSAAR